MQNSSRHCGKYNNKLNITWTAGTVVGMFFQDGCTNRVTQVFCFSSLHQRCNRAFDTSPQKTSCYICKQSIDHPTATVPGPEVSTFPGFGDKRHVQNFLCQLFVVLQWRNLNGQFFNTKNVKTVTKGFRIANHTWSQDHAFDFENPSIIDKGGFRTGKALEAWHTKLPMRMSII